MAYDPSNYIKGVDQRTVSEQRRDAKVDANKKKAYEAQRAKGIAAGAKRAAARDASNKAKQSAGSTKKVTPKPTVKAPVKKKVLVMPNKISPSKMTPAQKARYLKNPERYDY
jgi:hypothetical protein